MIEILWAKAYMIRSVFQLSDYSVEDVLEGVETEGLARRLAQ